MFAPACATCLRFSASGGHGYRRDCKGETKPPPPERKEGEPYAARRSHHYLSALPAPYQPAHRCGQARQLPLFPLPGEDPDEQPAHRPFRGEPPHVQSPEKEQPWLPAVETVISYAPVPSTR